MTFEHGFGNAFVTVLTKLIFCPISICVLNENCASLGSVPVWPVPANQGLALGRQGKRHSVGRPFHAMDCTVSRSCSQLPTKNYASGMCAITLYRMSVECSSSRRWNDATSAIPGVCH